MYDVIIIGSGPAGLIAAIETSKYNLKTLLIEKNTEIGKKLKITGGGRCNILNLKSVNSFIKELPKNNKSFYSLITTYSPNYLYEYIEKLGIKLKEEDNNRIFPESNKSKEVIDIFSEHLTKNKVELHLNEEVINIEKEKDIYIIHTTITTYKSRNLIIATGGASYPLTGSTGDGYKFANILNHPVTPLAPSETYIEINNNIPLPGITLEKVKITYNKQTIEGPLLITHIGLTGPTIFKLSEKIYQNINNDNKLYIDLIPRYTFEELQNKLNSSTEKRVFDFLSRYLSKKLANYILEQFNMKTNLKELSTKNKNILLNKIKKYELIIAKVGPLDSAIVTSGGVDLKNINTTTLESKIHRNLYFIGEVLDIHGNTGGYNITLCFSTGLAAANNIKEKYGRY